MKKKNPYTEEVKALLAEVRASESRSIACVRSRKYEWIILVQRTRMVWSRFAQSMQEYKTNYWVRKANFDGYSIAYNHWDIRLTQDPSHIQHFTAEEAVQMSKSLPFDNKIDWVIAPNKKEDQ